MGAKHITLHEYEAIKSLIDSGHDYKAVAKFIGRGKTTAYMIKNSSGFEDFVKKRDDVTTRSKMRRAKQLPLEPEKPKETTKDIQVVTVAKMVEARDEIKVYRDLQPIGTVSRQNANIAYMRVHEAILWLKYGGFTHD